MPVTVAVGVAVTVVQVTTAFDLCVWMRTNLPEVNFLPGVALVNDFSYGGGGGL